MTTLQLKAVLAAVKKGSISGAAKELGISQPNASNSIRTLEEEVGFPIFHRAKNGITLTEKGRDLVAHARRIQAESEAILGIRHREQIYRLRLGTVNYYSAIEPFLKLCEQHREDPETDFRYYSVSVGEGIRELIDLNLDIVFVPAMKSQLAGIQSLCEKNDLAMLPICQIPAVINVRKDHPAALDGRCQRITQGSDLMKEYPYITYRNLFNDNGSVGYNDSDFIACSSKLYVDEVDIRLRLVAAGNGFSFGLRPSKSLSGRYGIVSFPVDGIALDIFCLVRSGDQNRQEIRDYLMLLREELGLPPEDAAKSKP